MCVREIELDFFYLHISIFVSTSSYGEWDYTITIFPGTVACQRIFVLETSDLEAILFKKVHILLLVESLVYLKIYLDKRVHKRVLVKSFA